MNDVSRNRPRPTDRHRPLSGKPKPVGLAVITEPEVGAITCSCGGFIALHQRRKVREERAQAHLDKKHDGVGVWM